jgi:hypothetical protein
MCRNRRSSERINFNSTKFWLWSPFNQWLLHQQFEGFSPEPNYIEESRKKQTSFLNLRLFGPFKTRSGIFEQLTTSFRILWIKRRAREIFMMSYSSLFLLVSSCFFSAHAYLSSEDMSLPPTASFSLPASITTNVYPTFNPAAFEGLFQGEVMWPNPTWAHRSASLIEVSDAEGAASCSIELEKFSSYAFPMATPLTQHTY